MIRTTAALCLSLVLGITGTTRPAQANEDLLGQLLFGAVAAGIAYQVLRDYDNSHPAANPLPSVNRAAPPQARALRGPSQRPAANRGLRHGEIDVGPGWSPREKRRACRQVLPTRRGEVRFIADRCLNHPRARPRVPHACLRDRWGRGQARQVYSRQCLARYGQVR
ncbi:hypothetical protein [Tropicimonas sp. S265A]|uniref:hypothetical protein n=1 Tax=Tropicimonas sp. S265A TaxID=3415134 RepID=UPI003C7C4DC5